MGDAWDAAFDVNGNGCCYDAVFGYFNFYDAGFAVDGLLLVEDEIADAIVDGLASVVLNGLQRVGVVTYQSISTGSNQAVGIQSLIGHGL